LYQLKRNHGQEKGIKHAILLRPYEIPKDAYSGTDFADKNKKYYPTGRIEQLKNNAYLNAPAPRSRISKEQQITNGYESGFGGHNP
jgi:hypothetical protein